MLLDPNKLRSALKKLRAIQNPTRFKILRYLYKSGPASVNRIWFHLKGHQSFISQHLAVLKSAGIVYSEIKGKERIYLINEPEMERINEVVSELATFVDLTPNSERLLH